MNIELLCYRSCCGQIACRVGAAFAALVLSSVVGIPAAQAQSSSRVAELMKLRQYRDAIKLLNKEIAGKRDEDCANELLLLGECHYLLEDHATARPYLVRAARFLADERRRMIAEYRLACVAYRLGDRAGAREQIDAFAEKYPRDSRVGTLLLFRMKLLSPSDANAEKEMESVHKRISDGRETYGQSTVFVADKLLSDFYIQTGRTEKAKELYSRIVYQFRAVLSEHEKNKQPVPAAYEKSHDQAALELGLIAFREKQYAEATKWLENVRYDLEAKTKARLVLAQVAYESGNFDRAAWYLTEGNFIEFVPVGPVRSDMYLLLGLCEKQKAAPDLARMEGYLRNVRADSAGFAQAQAALGKLYKERGLVVEATKAYENALASERYAAEALFALGTLYMSRAEGEADPKSRDELCQKASHALNRLIGHYPLSPDIERARQLAGTLRDKGFDITFADADSDKVKNWERIARDEPGTPAATLALVNLARHHSREVTDEKTKQTVKAPDYAACAAACDSFLRTRIDATTDPDAARWQRLRCEAFLLRGQCELASAFADAASEGPMRPIYLKPADVEKAIGYLQSAKELVDPKDREMLKSVDLALVEAMLKSANEETQKTAREWFGRLADDYGTDLRFQKLAMGLAAWYEERGRFAEAAREYQGVAERGKDLPRDTLLKTLYHAGTLYSKAANEAQERAGALRYGIYIFPKEVVQLGSILDTYKPFKRTVTIERQDGGKAITGAEALALLSKKSGIPFVWSRSRYPKQAAIHEWLRKQRVSLTGETGTVEYFLRKILDVNVHRLEFDIGLTGEEPTIPPAKADPEDPDAEAALEASGAGRVIEIYDVSQEHTRYEPLARSYGQWRELHGDGPASRAVTLYRILSHIEKVTETRVLWAEGIEKEHVLGREYSGFPGQGAHYRPTCAAALAAVLEPAGLRFKVVPRDLSSEHYEKAKECFNEICKIAPKSPYGERALFGLALNYFRLKDYARMKSVLRHYLKVFDSPSYAYYHRACFWVGWTFEHEARYRDACHFYTLAAEERLVVYKPADGQKTPTREELKSLLSYDSLVTMTTPVSGEFKDYKLGTDFADLVRQHANLVLKLDPSAQSIDTPISRGRFENVPCLDVLCDALEALGLTFRVENVDRETAEKAYYRLAAAYKKDGLMEQALESLETLLARYPETSRLRDAHKLKLDIYKGLKDYGNVIATLEEMKKRFAGEIEPHKIDFEVAWVYFDLCRYDKAAEYFRQSLAGATDPAERLSIRDGYALALFRRGALKDALAQYEALAADETSALRRFIDQLMVSYLKFELGEAAAADLPPEAQTFILRYEGLTDEKREELPKSVLAQVAWVYYVQGLADLKAGRKELALKKLAAAANSPEDMLAADALYRVGRAHMESGDYEKAADTFEYLLFSTRTTEAEVKATYHLALCCEKLGKTENAIMRLRRLLSRFRDSAYAELAAKHPLLREKDSTTDEREK